MKIGILCTMLNEFGRKGYYNSQEIGLGSALRRQGHSVVIYKCVPKKEERETRQIESGLWICYVPTSGVGAHGYFHLKHFKPDMDALLCFADNQLFLPHIYRYCRKNGVPFVPYVGTAHGLWGDFRSKVSDFFFKKGTFRIYQKEKVLVKTDAAAAELAALGLKKEDMIVAPVGIDVSAFKDNYKDYNRESLKEKYGFARDAVVISFVARLQKEKRPLDLIDIFMKVKDYKKFCLLIVGHGPLRNELDAKIKECHITEQVQVIDSIPYGRIWEIYHLSDYFINLNSEEIFGMAVMEAVFYQTSVAAVDAPGPRMTLKGMKGHKICKNDQEITEWLLNGYPPEEYLEESASRICKEFTWDVCAKAFLKVVGQDIDG